MSDDEALEISEQCRRELPNAGDLGSYKRWVGAFARAIESRTTPAYDRFLSICSEELIRSSLTSLPLKIEFGRDRGMTLEQVDQWARDTRRMFRTAVEKRLEARQEAKGDGND